MTETREQQWENMRTWLSTCGVETYVRRTASILLQEDWPAGQGISSSDTSCAIMELYEDWKRAHEQEPKLELIVFLMEKVNHLR